MSKNELLISILRDSLSVPNYDSYKHIFILTEKGCINCNKSFTNLIKQNRNNNSLYIINALGKILDVSYFLETKSPNIVFDYDNIFIRNNFIKGSAYIDFSHQKMDTLIELEAKNLIDQLHTIEHLLKTPF